MPLQPGTRLGPYEIVAPIGAGGMGEVYRAHDPASAASRDKVLPAPSRATRTRSRASSRRRARSRRSKHPNILAIHDIGTRDGDAVRRDGAARGRDAARAARTGRSRSGRRVEFAAQIARGLAAAHEKGIVHRDLKPENLFVTQRRPREDPRLRPRQADAPPTRASRRRDSPDRRRRDRAGHVLGTVGYMSPEQVRGRAGRRALRHLLASARPLRDAHGPARVPKATGGRDDDRDPERGPAGALRRRPDDPPALERVVRHCLEKSPDERFHSAHDLAFALEAVSDPGASAGSATGSAAIASAPAAAPTEGARGRRRRGTGRSRRRGRLARGSPIPPRGGAVLQAADFPSRQCRPGALCARRRDHGLRRRVGWETVRRLLDAVGKPRLQSARRSGRGRSSRSAPRDFSLCRRGGARRSLLSPLARSPRRTSPAARQRASGSTTCSGQTGLPTASASRSFAIPAARIGWNRRSAPCSTRR